ncbi:MAG TPA: homoserine kinase, partial [Campylobacterales bacterium]|nr:homoserine kinase [Campylobacterales bacterium]
EVQRIALENGALMSTLSGSGSSFFSMTYADDAERVKRALEAAFGFFRVEIMSFDNDGLICQKS